MFIWPLLFLGMLPTYLKALESLLQIDPILYGISSLAINTNSSQCRNELNILYNAINEQQIWALNALDVSGVPKRELFDGKNFWLGSHVKCSLIQYKSNNEDNYTIFNPTISTYAPFKMGFARVYIKNKNASTLMDVLVKTPLEFQIQVGLCIPSSCNEQQISDLMNEYLDSEYLPYNNLLQLNLTLSKATILQDANATLWRSPATICLFIILALTMALSIIGTAYDVLYVQNQQRSLNSMDHAFTTTQKIENKVSDAGHNLTSNVKTYQHILTCFSLNTNIKIILNTKLSNSTLPFLHGLRLFGMIWVIVVHCILYMGDFSENVPFIINLSNGFFYQVFSNASYCVDTFFFISGFLLAYGYYKVNSKIFDMNETDQKPDLATKVFDIFWMTLKRFLRLTPPYAVLIVLSNVVFTHYEKTSSLLSEELHDNVCEKYWWRNLLYINNLYPRSEMCLSWSWYLAADTQFFVFSSILLTLSIFAFKTAAILLIGVIFISSGLTAYASYNLNYVPTMEELLNNLDGIYDLPWNRIGPYLIGIISAYIWKIQLKETLTLKSVKLVFCWIVFPSINLFILFALYIEKLPLGFYILYTGISRSLWGVGLGWLVISCATGNAGLVNKFLSYPGWIPLSRISYCAYLLNPLIITVIYMSSETPLTVSEANITLQAFGLVLLTYFVAFMFSILFEAPYILLLNTIPKLVKHRRTAPENFVKNGI